MSDFYRCHCSVEQGVIFPCDHHKALTREEWLAADVGEPMSASQAEDFWAAQRVAKTPLDAMSVIEDSPTDEEC